MKWGDRKAKEGNLTMHSTHFIYGYMASDIWLRTILIMRKETRCCHICYSFRLAARVLLYAPSHRQDSTYHGLCYTSRGALAVTRNSSMTGKHLRHNKNSTLAPTLTPPPRRLIYTVSFQRRQLPTLMASLEIRTWTNEDILLQKGLQ